MVRKYHTRKRKHSRSKRRHTKKTYKYRRGGTKYDSPVLLPNLLTYQDITDNSEFIREIQNPQDVNSYEIGKVYIIKKKDTSIKYKSNYVFKQYRVKDIINNMGENNHLMIFPVIPKGKTYARGMRPYKLFVNDAEYAYLVLHKYDNNEYYDTQREIIDVKSPYLKNVGDDVQNEIFSYLKR